MPIDFKVPELGENISGGDVVEVMVKEGDVISKDQEVVQIETGKAVLPIPSPYAGKIIKLNAAKGARMDVGSVLMVLEGAGAEAPAPSQPASQPAAQAAPTPAVAAAASAAAPNGGESDDDLLPAGPASRRLARELGVDLGRVQGSGPRGRITPEDVQAAAKNGGGASTAPAPVAKTVVAAGPAPTFDDRYGPIRRDKLPEIRKAIAAQMSRSSTIIPHVTNFDDVDITELDRIRKGVKPGQFGANVKLTLLPFVMKSVALALKEHPLINASIDEAHDQIVFKEYVHLGIAVDTPRGLVVPVLRNVDRMTIPEIARALASISERSRQSQFTLEDLKGGTFTISNLGAVGGSYSTPIINYPEVAILLPGRARLMPVVRDGAIEPRLMLPLSLSYDHRLIDGAEAARFLNKVIERLLSPAQLLLAE